MPIVNIIPTQYKKGSPGEACTIVFPDPNDCGKFGLDDINVINVWNGCDHFPGTRERVENFRDGIDTVFQKLMECSNICSNLQMCVEDTDVSNTIGKGIEVIKSVGYNLNKLFLPVEEDSQSQITQPRKKRKSQEPGDTRTDVESKFTNLHCACGVQYKDEDELSFHMDQKHKLNNNWDCVFSHCKKHITTRQGLRRHVISKHMGGWLHYCNYCSFGRNEKHLVVAHTQETHCTGFSYKCEKREGCTAVFNTMFKLKRHQKYCGEEKKFECEYCKHKFMREANMGHHIKVKHTHELSKVRCDYCLKQYESVAAYRQHFKKGNCKRFEVEGDDDEEEEEEVAPGEEQMEGIGVVYK